LRPLSHVYWIGGGSGSGKSTVARRLAKKHGLRLYSCDDVMGDHAERCPVDDCPLLADFGQMDMDERWVNRSPEVMLETFHWYQGEGFRFIIEDLSSFPAEEPVIAEGFRLLPILVQPLLSAPERGIWLLPTPKFRAAAFESRRTLWAIPNKTNNPERALRNLLARDAMFTHRIGTEATAAGLATIPVHTDMTEDALYGIVEKYFGL